MASLVGGAAAYTLVDLSTDSLTGAFKLERITARIPALPSAFEGYRIGFITDLHLGIWVPESWITSAFNAMRDAGCDLLVLGGDYIGIPENPVWELAGLIRNHDYAGIPKRVLVPMIFSKMAEIASSYSFRDGTIAVAGNHEHWNSTQAFLNAFSHKQGFSLLINRPFSISRGDESLTFFGTDDFLTGIPLIPTVKSFAQVTPKNSNILISHNPDLVAYGIQRDREHFPFSLSLCGHTHGGQISFPMVGPLTYQIRDARFGRGLFELCGKISYTSRGLGVVAVPYRVNCPAEVTVIELSRGESLTAGIAGV